MSAERGSAAHFEQALGRLGGRRVVLVVTGSLSAAFTPYWINYVSGLPRPPRLRIAVTRSATRMVSPSVLAALADDDVLVDDWDQAADGAAPHVDLAEWAEAFLVHPCTFATLGRIAQGLAETPVQLAMQTSAAPKIVCPALPPGTPSAPAYAAHLATLERTRPDVVVLPPTEGVSAATGRREGLPPAHFPVALAAVSEALAEADPVARPVA